MANKQDAIIDANTPFLRAEKCTVLFLNMEKVISYQIKLIR